MPCFLREVLPRRLVSSLDLLAEVCLTPQDFIILEDDNSSVKLINVNEPFTCEDCHMHVCCQTISSLVCNK